MSESLENKVPIPSIPKDVLVFAEWVDINCIRAWKHEWTYKGDNYSKRYSTQEIYSIWLVVRR